MDTPGFDDTTKSDTEILDDIARLLAAQYQLGVSLKGIVFLHRISDSRFSGTAGKTLNMFQKLCGKGALSNVILVTTRWSEIDESLGAVREKDLRNQFWTFMLNCGSTMARFLGDRDSALGIVSQLLGKSNVVLDIQRELVDEHKQLHETSAGAVVDDELAMLKQKATEELEQIEELRRSLQDSDSRMRDDMQRRWLEEQRRVKDADEMEKRLRRDISKEVREEIGKGVKKQRYRGIFPTILGVLGMFVGLDYSVGSGLVDGLQSLMDLY